MELSFDEQRALQARLAEVFAREGVDPVYLRFVLQHVDRPDVEWRSCCGSNCDPCVDRLGRLVDAARRELEIEP